MASEPSKHKRVHINVSGRVQGVSYRASAQQQAINLGVSGWVRNLASGQVEIEAQGNPKQIQSFTSWVRHGPALAVVESISVNEISTIEGDREFTIEPTG